MRVDLVCEEWKVIRQGIPESLWMEVLGYQGFDGGFVAGEN